MERNAKSKKLLKRMHVHYETTKELQNEKERNRNIIAKYLKAETTQEEIAEEFGVTQQAVGKIIENFTNNGKIAESCKNFKPFLYNVWNQSKIKNKTKHNFISLYSL